MPINCTWTDENKIFHLLFKEKKKPKNRYQFKKCIAYITIMYNVKVTLRG